VIASASATRRHACTIDGGASLSRAKSRVYKSSGWGRFSPLPKPKRGAI
jgi:hypothetical protein